MEIQMVDLKGQYYKIKAEIDSAVIKSIEAGAFINGPAVKSFEEDLKLYLNVNHVITCGNGTDALQIALMALNLNPGDEVICPAFTYAATAEVLALLKLIPVMVDVNYDTFNMDINSIERNITSKTKAIIPVHLFGQCADMDNIMSIAQKYGLFVIEDAAQSIGSKYTFSNGEEKKSGTIGHIGCTSFFPSKNLGCYGDGGAVFTNDDILAKRIRMVANHGQEKKYFHSIVGCNSRLDTLQAEILKIKLQYLDEYNDARNNTAKYYDKYLSGISGVELPYRDPKSTHVFHQYTLKVNRGNRDALKKFLFSKGIPSMIYYPLPLNFQEAFSKIVKVGDSLAISEKLCTEVLSLPIHSEFDEDKLECIVTNILSFFEINLI